MIKQSDMPPKTRSKNPRKKSQNERESIWLEEELMKYYQFIISYAIDQPHSFLSWQRWKPSHYFVKMARYIGTKNQKQVKSFDQRKKQNGQNLTMLQWVIKTIKEEYWEYPNFRQKLRELKKVIEEQDEDLREEIKESRQAMKGLIKDISDEDEIFINK